MIKLRNRQALFLRDINTKARMFGMEKPLRRNDRPLSSIIFKSSCTLVNWMRRSKYDTVSGMFSQSISQKNVCKLRKLKK